MASQDRPSGESTTARSASRIVVVGTSCSGKTRFARELAQRRDCPHVQLDEIAWLPGWHERPEDELRERVVAAADSDSWVIDGNYSKLRDIVWTRATDVIWLDYSFPVIFSRALRRTVRRVWTQEEACNGNRESFRRAFLSHDSILMWVLITFRHNRRKYTELEAHPDWKHLRFVRLRSSAIAADWLLGS